MESVHGELTLCFGIVKQFSICKDGKVTVSVKVYSETVSLFRNATRVCVLCVADEMRNDDDG